MNKTVTILLIALSALSPIKSQIVGLSLRSIALQSIQNITTAGNLPDDLQAAVLQLQETAVSGFDSCDEIQQHTMQVWRHKMCSALQFGTVQMGLATIRQEQKLRESSNASVINAA